MLDTLTVDHFRPYLNQTFTIHYGDAQTLEVTLYAAEAYGDAPQTDKRQRFSVFFQSDITAYLPQGMYNLSHLELGTLEGMFIVPIGNFNGIRYEAAFS